MSQDANEPLSWVGNACVERGNELVEQEIIIPPCGPAAVGEWQFKVIECSGCKGQGTTPGRYLDGQPDPLCVNCQGRKTLAVGVKRKETEGQENLLPALERIAVALEKGSHGLTGTVTRKTVRGPLVLEEPSDGSDEALPRV